MDEKPSVFARKAAGLLKRLLANVYCSARVVDVIGLIKAGGIGLDVTDCWNVGKVD
jgi:hypothetical protein